MADDREKKSWREIDKLRESSRSREGGGPSSGGKGKARAQKTYRAALDRLFDSGGIGKLLPKEGAAPPSEKDVSKQKSLKRALEALGRDEITRAVDAYVNSFGLPNDFDFLGQALEHRDEAVVAQAIDALAQRLATEKPRRARTLDARLRSLEETASDPALRARAAEVRRKLQ